MEKTPRGRPPRGRLTLEYPEHQSAFKLAPTRSSSVPTRFFTRRTSQYGLNLPEPHTTPTAASPLSRDNRFTSEEPIFPSPALTYTRPKRQQPLSSSSSIANLASSIPGYDEEDGDDSIPNPLTQFVEILDQHSLTLGGFLVMLFDPQQTALRGNDQRRITNFLHNQTLNTPVEVVDLLYDHPESKDYPAQGGAGLVPSEYHLPPYAYPPHMSLPPPEVAPHMQSAKDPLRRRCRSTLDNWILQKAIHHVDRESDVLSKNKFNPVSAAKANGANWKSLFMFSIVSVQSAIIAFAPFTWALLMTFATSSRQRANIAEKRKNVPFVPPTDVNLQSNATVEGEDIDDMYGDERAGESTLWGVKKDRKTARKRTKRDSFLVSDICCPIYYA